MNLIEDLLGGTGSTRLRCAAPEYVQARQAAIVPRKSAAAPAKHRPSQEAAAPKRPAPRQLTPEELRLQQIKSMVADFDDLNDDKPAKRQPDIHPPKNTPRDQAPEKPPSKSIGGGSKGAPRDVEHAAANSNRAASNAYASTSRSAKVAAAPSKVVNGPSIHKGAPQSQVARKVPEHSAGAKTGIGVKASTTTNPSKQTSSKPSTVANGNMHNIVRKPSSALPPKPVPTSGPPPKPVPSAPHPKPVPTSAPHPKPVPKPATNFNRPAPPSHTLKQTTLKPGGYGSQMRSGPCLPSSSRPSALHRPLNGQKRPGRDLDLDSDSYDDDFIDDDVVEEDWRAEMRKVTRYDPRKFRDERGDDRAMEAGWRDIEAEEKRSARLGRKEDEREEELERQRTLQKHKAKKPKKG